MITIALADDDPLFTAGLAMILDAQEDLHVLWQAVDGADAIRQHRHTEPDVLLLDIQMPGTDGLTATQQLISEGTAARIIILTTFESDEYVLTAVEAGAAGFLLKNTPPDELIDAIRTVYHGDSVISPGPTRRLFSTFRSRPAPSIGLVSEQQVPADLTSRESEVLTLIARGLSNQEICDQLWLSMPTVKTHIGNLLAKTHSRDRVQLVLYALRNGIASAQ
ncbi:response regulator transcription factor [Brevibacterium picturae]|uniref:Response regulator transcription factor n=1 Tax=Brevibacterium picturae TaxID=260553 RepID=A0ABN2CRP3_9MICO